jgi:hypothetical protein
VGDGVVFLGMGGDRLGQAKKKQKQKQKQKLRTNTTVSFNYLEISMTTARWLIWSPHEGYNQFLVGSSELKLYEWLPEVKYSRFENIYHVATDNTSGCRKMLFQQELSSYRPSPYLI